MREKRYRSLIKTITWRIIAVTTSFFAALLFGVDLDTSIKLVIFANAVSMIAYYGHERVWNKINKGIDKDA